MSSKYDPVVAEGIKFMDENAEGWCEKIELETLDLGSLELCVLGQAFDTEAVAARRLDPDALFHPNNGYTYARRKFDIGITKSVNLGFALDADSPRYHYLTAAWKRAIKEHCNDTT